MKHRKFDLALSLDKLIVEVSKKMKKKNFFYYFYVMVDYIFDLYKYKDSWGKFVLSKFCWLTNKWYKLKKTFNKKFNPAIFNSFLRNSDNYYI
jgi:hypothetical protein